MSRLPPYPTSAPTCAVKKSPKEKLTRAAGTKIDILTSISGYVQSGHVLAIIGPSGAGKTTLLDALAARMPAEDPTSIRLNGEVMTKDIFRSHCSYMPQDDRYVCTWRHEHSPGLTLASPTTIHFTNHQAMARAVGPREPTICCQTVPARIHYQRRAPAEG